MSSQTGRETFDMLMPPITKVNHTHQQAMCSGVLDAMTEYMMREQTLQPRLHVHLHVTPYYPVSNALLKWIIYSPIAKMSPPPYMELTVTLVVCSHKLLCTSYYYCRHLCQTGLPSSHKWMAKEQRWILVMLAFTTGSHLTVLTGSLSRLLLVNVFQLVMHHHKLIGAWIGLLCMWSTTSTSLGKDASPGHVEPDCWDRYVEDVRHILESHALLDTFCCFC